MNLYLLLSNDKENVLAVAKNEKQPVDAKEIIIDPMLLEFLGLKRESSYYEKDLESAIIIHLQDFRPTSKRILIIFQEYITTIWITIKGL